MTNTRIGTRAGRHLVLIDIENIAATPSPCKGEVAAAVQALREVVPDFDLAQRVVASSHHAALEVGIATPGYRHLWRSGPDGADLALLEVLETEAVEDRFEIVTVCSGDGIFAESAARLAEHGVHVSVVSLSGHLAARLHLAARRVMYLPMPQPIFFTGSAS